MKKLLIIGAGDLGQQICHFVTTDNQYDVVGFVDDWKQKNELVCGHLVYGCINDTEKLYQDGVFDEVLIGIGYKHFDFRKAVYERFKSIVPFGTFVHSTCYVDPTAEIGKGVVIYPRCIIDKNAQIKDNVFINWGSGIGHDAIVESHTFVAAMVLIAGLSHVGEKCMIGNGTVTIDHISIADSTTIGGGAVVVKNIVEPNGVYVGNPARFLKNRVEQ